MKTAVAKVSNKIRVSSSKSNPSKKITNRITNVLRQFKDDWLPTELVLPSYKGFRYSKHCIARSASAQERRDRIVERETLHYLRRKGWIEISKTAEGLMTRLSDLGKMERLLRTLQERPKLKNGVLCLVVFDIPEQARKSRDAFRSFLRVAGFSLVQRSVWTIDHDVLADVSRFIEDAGIGKWVQVFVGSNVNKDVRS